MDYKMMTAIIGQRDWVHRMYVWLFVYLCATGDTFARTHEIYWNSTNPM